MKPNPLDPASCPERWAAFRTPEVRAEVARLLSANPGFAVQQSLSEGKVVYTLRRSPPISEFVGRL